MLLLSAPYHYYHHHFYFRVSAVHVFAAVLLNEWLLGMLVLYLVNLAFGETLLFRLVIPHLWQHRPQ